MTICKPLSGQNTRWLSGVLLSGWVCCVCANPFNPDISLILDGIYKTENTALSEYESGFGLGHTELSMRGAVDDQFYGSLSAVLESHAGATEVELEEVYINTIGLPAGLDIRAGRFLSQIGYLNSHHTHSDLFTERPAVYRALLGAHYFDDGVRMNVLLPTPFYWRMGVEAFNGRLLTGGESTDDIGVYTLNSRWGGDFLGSNSWQLGVSWLKNRLDPVEEAEDHDDGEDGHDHDGHAHSHDAAYSGENMFIADAVWKWAPHGNAQLGQLILAGEYFYVDDLNEYATDDDFNEGWYASVVYRFNPRWSAGVRYGNVELKEVHGDHFHDQQLEEGNVMLAWSPSHFSTVRLQYTNQQGKGFDELNDAITLQYVMSLGAHGAHEF
ncbi:hypothetical protein [Ketobacter sp.]|uniref:hypothetical protein n=1 Tax=Ketobacter sp. TaxID=2083498 RepID=UPI0025C54919|nr:hypothetical protein [Ketobacter sp.]